MNLLNQRAMGGGGAPQVTIQGGSDGLPPGLSAMFGISGAGGDEAEAMAQVDRVPNMHAFVDFDGLLKILPK